MNNYALEENPNCAETHIAFRFVGERLDPAAVSDKLRLAPDIQTIKGQQLTAGRDSFASRSVWAISSKDKVSSTSLERHLVWLLEVLEPVRSEIAEIGHTFDCSPEFHCYWMSETGHGGPIISKDSLRRVANLGAYLDFDFYCSQ